MLYFISHQEGEAGDIVGEIFDAYFRPRASNTDGADKAALHRGVNVTEDMLDTDAHARFFGVRGLLLFA